MDNIMDYNLVEDIIDSNLQLNGQSQQIFKLTKTLNLWTALVDNSMDNFSGQLNGQQQFTT